MQLNFDEIIGDASINHVSCSDFKTFENNPLVITVPEVFVTELIS